MRDHYLDFVLKLNRMAWPNDQHEKQKDPKAGLCATCHPPDKIDIFMNYATNMSLITSRAAHLFAAHFYKVFLRVYIAAC